MVIIDKMKAIIANSSWSSTIYCVINIQLAIGISDYEFIILHVSDCRAITAILPFTKTHFVRSLVNFG